MTDNQKIIQRMGRALWQIFPTNAALIEFRAQLYHSSNQCGPEWFDTAGNRLGPQTFDDYPHEVNDDLRSLALELQRTPPFDRKPFTHMRYELNSEGKVNVDFAYIPEWDSWPGLFMQGVSDVPKEEAETRPIFYKTWLECCARREREPYER